MDWFRFYSEVVRDPKVQRLTPPLFKHWVNLLCLANDYEPRGQVPPAKDVAFHLRLPLAKTTHILKDLTSLGLLDDVDGVLTMHGWAKRQLDTGALAESGAYGNHTRWHVARGLNDPSCSYCQRIATRLNGDSPQHRDSDSDQKQIRTEANSDRAGVRERLKARCAFTNDDWTDLIAQHPGVNTHARFWKFLDWIGESEEKRWPEKPLAAFHGFLNKDGGHTLRELQEPYGSDNGANLSSAAAPA